MNRSGFRGKAVAVCTHCNGFGDQLSLYGFRSKYPYSSTATPAPHHLLVKYLVDSLGFSNEEAASTSSKYGFRVVSSQKKSMLDRKIGIFKSFGWSDDDILHMFRKLPYCLALSEVRIQKALNLFMKELGVNSAYLVSYPYTCDA
ncbi:hypothetical protein H5410_023810 [Solanum commersonii]|uniref:Uncharacterized protein n=1 Tax=Solanum commersonii TaxID=4109 RepID=A0A9J5ZK71_SOLCO|nr:hypothetical protein H5410_023810 [Solanum commersonii]